MAYGQMLVYPKIGPNGTIEIKQANAVQGWHSGYVTPARARELALELVALADQLEPEEKSDG